MTQDDAGSAPMRGSVANRLAASLRDMNDEILARGADYSDVLLDSARELDRRSWIPVAERLPELVERVMVCNANDGWVTIGSRELTGTYHHWDGDDYEELCEPTHWMPLPEPPLLPPPPGPMWKYK